MKQPDWKELVAAEATCKETATCPRLGVRELFFEPNPSTLKRWQSKHQFYLHGIDRRVVFIAERPSDRRKPTSNADFWIGDQKGWCCYDLTRQDERFRKGRLRYGLQDCLITNVVKCGLRGKRAKERPTSDEARSCARFLIQELEAVKPVVVACLGESAFRLFMGYTLPHLSFTPCPLPLTHYSYQNSDEELLKRWDAEFATINAALKARGATVPDHLPMASDA